MATRFDDADINGGEMHEIHSQERLDEVYDHLI
jgi:hypothetical protein